MTVEPEHEEHPRRSRTWFGRGVVGIFALGLGGCIAVRASASDPLSGLADEDDYRLTLSSCEVVDGTPMGSGTIRSTNAELESFRVQVWAYDNETAEVVASNSRLVAANTEQAETFDLLLLDLSDVSRTVQPGSVSCAARVFLNS